jgi:hypothetical protein
MDNKYITNLCPPDDNTFKSTISFTLHTHEDGQQYLVLTDYDLDLVPGKMTGDWENLFNGNKVLGKLTVAYCKM